MRRRWNLFPPQFANIVPGRKVYIFDWLFSPPTSTASLWELAAADVHQRKTEAEEEAEEGGGGGGGDPVAERSVFLMGSKAGVSGEHRCIAAQSLFVSLLARCFKATVASSFRAKRQYCSSASTGE